MTIRMSTEEFKRLNQKENKYHAEKATVDGVKFDSLAEEEMYRLLKADKNTLHIDCHVPVTLSEGVRFNVDFVVWPRSGEKPYCVEVKGKKIGAFIRLRKLFDAFHPMAPMQVYSKQKGKWVCL